MGCKDGHRPYKLACRQADRRCHAVPNVNCVSGGWHQRWPTRRSLCSGRICKRFNQYMTEENETFLTFELEKGKGLGSLKIRKKEIINHGSRSHYSNMRPSPARLESFKPWLVDVRIIISFFPHAAWQLQTAILFPAVKQRLVWG